MRNHLLSTVLALSCVSVPVLAADGAERHDKHMATLKPAQVPAALDASGGVAAEYSKAGDKAVAGTLYEPAKRLPGAPGVVVIHEWWGLNDQVRAEAKKLAAAGFVALAVDLYGGQVASEPEAAKKLAGAARGDVAGVVKNLADAVGYLKGTAKCGKVGSLGWCMGGGFSLELGLQRPDEVGAVAMYYGQVKTTAAEVAALKAPLLGHFGGEDQGIPVADVRKFRELLKGRAAEARVIVYKGAGHAFANPTRMQTYRAEDAGLAWDRTVKFLRRNLVVRPAGHR